MRGLCADDLAVSGEGFFSNLGVLGDIGGFERTAEIECLLANAQDTTWDGDACE